MHESWVQEGWRGADDGSKGKGGGDSMVYLKRRKLSTVGKPGHYARDCRSLTIVGEGASVEED